MSETTRALAVVDAAAGGMAPEQRDLIKRTCLAPEATDDEFALFMVIAQQTGLNPLARQIYAIHRYDSAAKRKRMTIQTGIDGYRLIAARTSQLAGIDDPVYDTEDGEHPNKATVTVWRMVRGQRCPFTASARWTEYSQHDSNGKLMGLWARMPWLMLGKCAEALALRKAFPAELSGLYTDTEMDQADNPASVVTVNAQRHPAAAGASDSETVSLERWEALKARMRTECKLTTVQLAATFMRAHIGRDLGGALPTLAEYDKLIGAVNRAAKQLRTVERTTRPADDDIAATDDAAMEAARAEYLAAKAADAGDAAEA